jgi:hypothetical protein
MITSAVWTDYNQDTWPDLMICGEWMSVTVFPNAQGRLGPGHEITPSGWWNALSATDFDRDGDMDYVAGNLGRNSRFQASAQEPVRLHVVDLDGNGFQELLLNYFIEGQSYLSTPRDQLAEPCPMFRRRFPKYSDYGKTPFEKAFSPEELARAKVWQSTMMESVYIENLGKGQFLVRPLPIQAQVAPVFGIQPGDYNQDGLPDIALTGNHLGTDVQLGWYDAFKGLILCGDGKGGFTPHLPAETGFLMAEDGKSLVMLAGRPGQSPYLVAACNNGPAAVYTLPTGRRQVRMFGPHEATATLVWHDGHRQQVEAYPGNAHGAQPSRMILYDPAQVLIELPR